LMLDSWRRPSASPSWEALRARVLPFLTQYVEAGKLGLKSGNGFYDYPGPTFQAPTFLAAEPGSKVASDALLSTLVCSAVSLVANDVAEPEQVDLAWTAATGQGIGPFGILDQTGSAAFLAILEEQVSAGLLGDDAALPTRAYLRA
jgi:enoyl-CoA hydratase/3-hydroxyacyl-CoA dehydrogenase